MAANSEQIKSSHRLDLFIRILISLLLFAAVLGIISAQVAQAQAPHVNTDFFYTVQSGDTLQRLAVKYSTTVDDIIAANDLPYPFGLSVGESLLIPAGLSPARSPHEAISRFYQWYLAEDDAGSHPLASGLYQASPLLSDAFKQELDEMLADTDWNGDPLLCGGGAQTSMLVTAERLSNEEARAILSVSFDSHAFNVTVSKLSGEWQMDGIECGAD